MQVRILLQAVLLFPLALFSIRSLLAEILHRLSGTEKIPTRLILSLRCSSPDPIASLQLCVLNASAESLWVCSKSLHVSAI